MRTIAILITSCTLLLNAAAYGASAKSMNTIAKASCSEPRKPQVMNKKELKKYRQAVEKFRTCITSFAKKHNELAKKYHQQAKDNREAANNALDTWNEFASKELGKKR